MALAFAAARVVAPAKPMHGAAKQVFGILTLDASYPDDGYTESQLLALDGLSPYIRHEIYSLQPLGGALHPNGIDSYPAAWDSAGKRLRFYDSGPANQPHEEVPAADADLDGVTASIVVIGY